jgi:hypothetical protein
MPDSLLPLRGAVSVWACAVQAVLDETRRLAKGGKPDPDFVAALNETIESARCACERAAATLTTDPCLLETLRLARLYGLQWDG